MNVILGGINLAPGLRSSRNSQKISEVLRVNLVCSRLLLIWKMKPQIKPTQVIAYLDCPLQIASSF